MGFTGYITKVHKQIAVYASYGQLYRKHFDKSWALKYTFRPLCWWLSLAKSPVGESVGPVGQKKNPVLESRPRKNSATSPIGSMYGIMLALGVY